MESHIIKNFSTLATSQLREDALLILEAGLDAVNTERAVQRSVSLDGDVLTIGDRTYDLGDFRRILVIGFGKAAVGAAGALENVLGSRIDGGLVLDVTAGALEKIQSVVGTHPFPSESNVRATEKIVQLLREATKDDLIITIVSGGGSALLCLPHEVACSALAKITALLMKKGASIMEINTVRKHLSRIQGGQFASIAAPATVASLIFSDIAGGDMALVASGPTMMDTSTIADAQQIMIKYDVLNQCNLPTCELIETPKDPEIFKRVHNTLAVSNLDAVQAMQRRAEEMGYAARILSSSLEGEAREVGQMLAKLQVPGEAVIAAGETTISIRGDGRGGRNQELVLSAVAHIRDGGLILSCASDGIDNTPVAGALADQTVKEHVDQLNIDIESYLASNNSYDFFQKIGTYIETGNTGRNVSDLMIVLHKK